jgi:hypothetical protein
MTLTLGVLLILSGSLACALTLRWWLAERTKEGYSFSDRNTALGIAGLGFGVVAFGFRLTFDG